MAISGGGVRQLRIRVLGALEASRKPGEESILLRSRKLAGLLAYLAMSTGNGQSRETLATLLWDRSAEEQARASLRQALAVLRKAIERPGDSFLTADDGRVSLASERVWVDAIEFQKLVADASPEALRQAATLYRGRLLDGLNPGSEVFEAWLRAEGQRLQDLAMRAFTKLLALHRESGELDLAIGAAHRILAIDPEHEDAHRALIDLYVCQGARGEARRHYDRYREMLRRELGLEPDEETRQLAQRLLFERASPDVAFAPSSPPAPGPNGTRGDEASTQRGVSLVPLDAEPKAPAYRAGRRFVTLVSCNLADAAAMATRLDPEDLGVVLAGFNACCEGVIRRHGGHVLHRLDHTVSACFGHPAVDEHDPERAVRAALELVAQVGRLTALTEAGLQARVGIASGWVMLSERILDGGMREDAIAGAEPHVVAGLAAMAEPGSVLVAESTRTLLGALFDYEEIGARQLDGLAAPVRVSRVLGERAGQSRFTAKRGATALAPLVGREEEVDVLLRRWQRARVGAGQVVVLVGEPGIGKSRLIETLRERLAGESHRVLGYYCSPHHLESAFYPVIQQLEHAAGFSRGDAPAAKLDKLEALLARGSGDLSVDVPLVADLLSVPCTSRYPTRNLTPQRQREETLEILERQLVALAGQQPVLMVFEDVHWSDPGTREVLERVVDRVRSLPVLVAVTHRPGTSLASVGESHVSTLVLKRLVPEESQDLVAKIVGAGSLPQDFRERIVDRADGVPLFIEELTKNALEASAGRERENSPAAPRSRSTQDIPETLYDLLVARLDRLGAARVASQEAAVIGRRFSYELLAAVSALEEPQLQVALAALVDAELAHVRGMPPRAIYTFKHALVQDAAYASLLRSERARLHGRVASALEARFPEMRDAEPDVLAHHYAEAGLESEAIPYWQSAGELAARRWAYREAVAHFDRALAALNALPSSGERNEQELKLQVSVSQAWTLAAGYTAPQVEAALDRARQLCEEIGDAHQLFFALLGSWQLYIARQQLTLASDAADRLLSLARQAQNKDLEIEAHVAQVVTLYTKGLFEPVLAHANAAIELGSLKQDAGHLLSAGYDGRAMTLSGAAWALWTLGYPEQALKRSREVLATARRLAHPYTEAMSLYCCSWLHVFRREAAPARELAREGIALSTEHGFLWARAFSGVLYGWALAEEGRAAEGIQEIRRSLEMLKQMGHTLWRPHQLGLLASALSRAGQIEEAQAVVAEALELASRTGDVEHTAELHRLKGELTLAVAAPGAAERAEQCFCRAIEIAREGRAKSWELRATASLARLWRDQGKREQALAALAPVHDWFMKGLDTRDLQEAKALLDQLAADAEPPRTALSGFPSGS